ncbi:hypothetical protein ACM26V_16845 [Salipaludibacillus sp. HK11]|uniref:hypothetical protein n=1 Tax=Salipaludibacillus sp. HK11 TaxID=3394320 RepID=UPI0039FBFFBE
MMTIYQECTIYEVARDGYGKPIKKNAKTIKCRVKENYQLVKNRSAVEVVSKMEIMTFDDITINPDFKVEFEGLEYTILSTKLTRNTLGEVVKRVVYV